MEIKENLTRYVESASIDNKLIVHAASNELKESLSKCTVRLKESIDTSEGWWVPISFYGKKNGNGRIYNKKLWENVINNQRETWCGAPMLADHPSDDSDGSPKDICGVWLDAKMEGAGPDGIGLVYGLLVPSGHIGEDLKDHLRKGLRVGTSSSGFGKLMSDGVTVDPSSYLIERLSDWVLNPSQGTFFSYEESDDNVVNKSIRESEENKKTIDSFKENIVKDSKIAKLEEKKFRRDMESFLEDAAAIKDPQERLQEFREIKSYLEDGACPDLREKIEEKIAAEEELIKKAVDDKITLQEKFGIEGPKDLEAKITRIVEEASIADKEAKDWKAIAEKLQAKLQEAKNELSQRPTKAFAEWQRKKINELQANLDEANTRTASTREAFKKQFQNISKTVTSLKSDLEESNNKVSTSEKELLEAKRQLTLGKRALTEGRLIANLQSERTALSREKLLAENRDLKSRNSKLSSMIEEKDNTSKELKKSLKEAESKLAHATSNVRHLTADVEGLSEKLHNKNMAVCKTGVALSNASVEDYVAVLQESFGASILPFKKELLSCRNLTEAKQKFYGSILGRMKESREIDKLRIPTSTGISAKERAAKLSEAGKTPTTKESAISRMRAKGWK